MDALQLEAATRPESGNPLYVFAAGADDPWQLLGFLPAASSVEFVETQTVRGTETRHYRAVVTLADLAAIGDAQTRPGRQRFQEKVGLDQDSDRGVARQPGEAASGTG